MSPHLNRLFPLAVAAALAGCAPAPAALPGSLARGPLSSALPTSTTVGPADTGPAGSAASVGDGTAALGR